MSEIEEGILRDSEDWDSREHYDCAFNEGYSIGRREVTDQVQRITDRIDSKGYDNVSKQDIVFALRTIMDYNSQVDSDGD